MSETGAMPFNKRIFKHSHSRKMMLHLSDTVSCNENIRSLYYYLAWKQISI